MLVLKNNLSVKSNNLSLSLKAKYLVFNKLGIKFGINKLFNVTSTEQYDLFIESPDWYLFKNGTKKSNVLSGDGSDFKGSFNLKFGLSYDIALTYPIYLSPFIEINNSLNSVSKSTDFSFVSVNFGVNCYFGIANLKLF